MKPEQLLGANAPAVKIDRFALIQFRPPFMVMPNNAPAHNYRAHIAGNHVLTPIQSDVVDTLMQTKMTGKQMDSQSWIGKKFGY